MWDGRSVVIAVGYAVIIALTLLVSVLIVGAVIKNDRANRRARRQRMLEHVVLIPADDAQPSAVRDLLASWKRMTAAPALGLWGAGLAMTLYLLTIIGIAVVARQSFNALLAGLYPCIWLGWLIGDQTVYLRDLARLPRDTSSAPTPVRPTRSLAAWAYWLSPYGLFALIAALALDMLQTAPFGALTWDVARTQTNRRVVVFVLVELTAALVASLVFIARQQTIAQRQFTPDPMLSQRADAAFREYVADQRRLALLATLFFGFSALSQLTDLSLWLTLVALPLAGLVLWLRWTRHPALVVA
ncbi:MAG TPA: hypothetical protein VMV29_01685 [Ktedonobacterales bacterium]|nr:hypothetical protein [Ktedonobacterales bacterium]